jgi:ribosome-interacting GTPase 1
MGDDRKGDPVNRAVEEHVRQLRARLAAGREEIARQRNTVDSNREHIDGVQRWIAESERIRGGPA